MSTEPSATQPHYRKPGWFTRNVLNRAIRAMTRAGISVWGSRVLEVPGRRSGQPQQVPVNLLELDGTQYLVSARGHGQWVRNVRANEGRLDLLVGRRRSSYVATELPDADKAPILRAYLVRWKAEVGAFFDGVDAQASDDELIAIAHKHPVFVLRGA
ncbi:MAG TPA: nitroreductase family deazaflavin-dependent oxidoreductase [Acidimicrobiales bacterium]